MKKTYVIVAILVIGTALYSLFAGKEDKLNAPGTASPQQVEGLASPAAPGINPAHGQPGHRCDIMVGAPLPASGDSPAQPSAGSTSTPAVAPAAMKVNPAHGQPGHRCDIAVGDPLP